MCRIDERSRFDLLKKAITQNKALAVIDRQIETLKEQQSQYSADKYNDEEEYLLNVQHLKELQ
ncbi:hypothetical protein [Nostoc sp. DSM 114161]|uniref:hypothetical protein n=1 Tax=Nostoc sp. DSM 114161 TaxID=3440143 RepID=UPI004045E89E